MWLIQVPYLLEGQLMYTVGTVVRYVEIYIIYLQFEKISLTSCVGMVLFLQYLNIRRKIWKCGIKD
jgi:hypothetical protein